MSVHAQAHCVEGVLKYCVSGCEYLGVTREGVVLHSTRRHGYGSMVRAGHMTRDQAMGNSHYTAA